MSRSRRSPPRWHPGGAGACVAALALALLAFAVVACREAQEPTAAVLTPSESAAVGATPPPPTASAPGATTRPPPDARPFPPESAGELRDLLARTAALRGLQPLRDVPSLLIGRDAAADYLVSSIDAVDRREIELRQEVYRLLGLIPTDSDLLDLQITLLRGAVLGFYDPDVGMLFILDDLGLSSTVSRLTLVHEFAHALQDQHFDLNAIEERLRADWDAAAAWVAVVEGDARSLEVTFLNPAARPGLGRFCNDDSFRVNSNSRIPAVIQRELNTPYTDGLCFVRSVMDRIPGGVDALFKELPSTTEQILHPEKYLAGEGARPITLPGLEALLGPGWRRMGSSTLGEFALQNLLLLGVSNVEAVKRAAAGWGGDRWALYGTDSGARLFHLAVAWDSAAEAREFWDTFLTSLTTRSRGNLRPSPAATAVTWDQAGRPLRAALSGDTVTVIVATDAAVARAASAALGLP